MVQRDEFDDPEGTSLGEKLMSLVSLGGRGFAAGAIVAAIVLLGLVLWIAYPSGDSDNSGEVPIIRADSGAYKTTPDDPGGMDVPHRDSTVFKALGDENPDNVENLLADNDQEEPMEKSELFAGLNTNVDGVPPQPEGAQPMKEPTASEDLMPVFKVEEEKKEKAETTITDEIQKIEPAPIEREASAEEAVAATSEPAAGTTAPAAIADGTHFVQLASIKEKERADAEFKKFQSKYSALSAMGYRLEEANLGDKGTFYRIQAGPVSKDKAASACESIKSAGGSCLVAAK